jgi:hypothetical protein
MEHSAARKEASIPAPTGLLPLITSVARRDRRRARQVLLVTVLAFLVTAGAFMTLEILAAYRVFWRELAAWNRLGGALLPSSSTPHFDTS